MDSNKNTRLKKNIEKMKDKKVIILFFIVVFLLLLWWLPTITSFLNETFFKVKVDLSKTKLSRLELVKLTISLIGPILTVMVFQNTLKMQKKSEDRQEKLEEKQRQIEKESQSKENERSKREMLIQIDNEFYKLLDLFLKYKGNKEVLEEINSLEKKAINDKKYGFINDYDYKLKPRNIQNSYVSDEKYGIAYWLSGQSAYLLEIFLSEVELEDIKYDTINKQFESVYQVTGNYFKILHRIIKTLNEYLDDKTNPLGFEEYSKYIGVLRTQITSSEFLVILYNSIYIKRGLGLGIQLIGSGFFGDELDFKTSQHFETPNDELWYLNKTIRNEDNRIERTKLSNTIRIQIENGSYSGIKNFKILANYKS